jgi:hypothetical protein
MPIRIPLPSGGWADLAGADELTERRRRPVKAMQMRVAKGAMTAGADLSEPPNPSPETRATMDPGELAAIDQQREEWGRQVFMAVEIDDQLDADGVYIAAFTVGWSFDAPVSADAVLDIPAADYDALKAAVEPLVKAVFLDTSPRDLAQPSPTGPSSG